jgi:hypothetical protein
MYRRNLDIAVAAVVAILGGLAAAAHLPGAVTIPLGAGLFFAPGYLWSEAIISQRLPGIERTMTSVGMALILPILGGFLFFALHIPLLKSAWVGMLVVLTLLGVVAVAVQRLREPPADPRRQQQQRVEQRRQPQRRNQPAPASSGMKAVHAGLFGLAALIGIGSVVFSVKSADAQKFPGYSDISMTQIVPGAQSFVGASQNSAGNPQASAATATQAHLRVDNHESAAEQYEVQLVETVTAPATAKKKATTTKTIKTYKFTLADNQTWQVTIPFTLKYKMVANLYILPDTTKVVVSANNGQ